MCCANFIVKYVLFFFNLIFVLAGLAIIGVGVAVLVQLKEVADILPVNLTTISTLIIVLGCVIFLIAFFGCCGAIKESRCLLIMYSVCMLVLAGIKIFVTVVVFRSLSSLQDTLGRWMQNIFDSDPLSGPFQALEVVFTCCGTTGSNAYTNQNLPIPPTCCANPVDSTCVEAGDMFRGCIGSMQDYIEAFGEPIRYVLIAIICVELVAMIFGLFLNHSITNKRRKHY